MAKVYMIRGMRVMLGRDLAKMFDVSAVELERSVQRNIKRFPDDFMVRLTRKEAADLGSRYAFTDLGIVMLTSVLNSEAAIKTNIAIMGTVPIFDLLEAALAGIRRKK